ncbi:MAG: lipopolysaccharide heptosyltransferase family protein [Alphaproteobacteria bacterium]|nr:lipopolysaccharide heptosyltransferase family protein [Alphaproteobacteria bacterium]
MRIVIFRTDKIGDLIVSSPVIAAIKTKHPFAVIMLVASGYNAVAARGLPGVDELVLSDESAFEKIRAFKPTHTLVLSPKEPCYTLSRKSGAQHQGWIIMEYRPWVRLLAWLMLPKKNREEIPRKSRSLHHSEHIMALAQRMGLAAQGAFPYAIPRDAMAEENIKARLTNHGIIKPFIAVHLVDKWVEENWQGTDVKNFLLILRDKLGVDIVASAGPADKTLSAALSSDILVLDNLSFGEWVALFAQSRMVITPDCAAVHIACALQKPLLALYQPSRMEVAMTEYGPRLTDYRTHALHEPKKIIPFLFRDTQELLGHHYG